MVPHSSSSHSTSSFSINNNRRSNEISKTNSNYLTITKSTTMTNCVSNTQNNPKNLNFSSSNSNAIGSLARSNLHHSNANSRSTTPSKTSNLNASNSNLLKFIKF